MAKPSSGVTPVEITSEAEALRTVEVFESVGVTRFYPILLDEMAGRKEAEIVNGAQLRRRLPDYLKRNATGQESLVVWVTDEQLIQVDDADEQVVLALQPFAFLTVMTSPGSYQVWLSLAEGADYDQVRERLLRQLRGTTANGGPFGAFRWPGSRNCKSKHRRADGSFPIVRSCFIARGRRVAPVELQRAGLLAPPVRLKLRPVARRIAFELLYATGITRLAAWCNRRRVIVLCYEGVTEMDYGMQGPRRLEHLYRDRFVEQLDYLRRRYHAIALHEYLAALRRGQRLPHYSVVLTFDEGYQNFLTVAAPRLAERGMPATVFLTTARVPERNSPGRRRHWVPIDDEVYLPWTRLQGLRREQGIELGVRVQPQPEQPGRALSFDEAAQLMRDGYADLVAHTGQDRPPLALRFCDYNAALASEASRVGFGAVLASTDVGANDGRACPSTLQRVLARDFEDDSLAAFAAQLSGLKVWWWRLARRKWRAIARP